MENGNAPANGLPIAGTLPFRSGSPRYHILRPKPGQAVRLVCTNPTIFGVKTHFVEGRTVPCTDDTRGHCDHCGERRPRWYGYMAGLIPEAGRLALGEVTLEAADKCAELHQVGTNLRGLMMKVERIGSNIRGRCYITFEPMRLTIKLPPPVNVPLALCAIWGVSPVVAGFELRPEAVGGEA